MRAQDERNSGAARRDPRRQPGPADANHCAVDPGRDRISSDFDGLAGLRCHMRGSSSDSRRARRRLMGTMSEPLS